MLAKPEGVYYGKVHNNSLYAIASKNKKDKPAVTINYKLKALKETINSLVSRVKNLSKYENK